MTAGPSTLAQPILHFVALTVTDVDTSVAWYEQLFGLRVAMEGEHETHTTRVLTDDAGTILLPLCGHRDNGGEAFSETRTGLDHVSFQSSSRARPTRPSSPGRRCDLLSP